VQPEVSKYSNELLPLLFTCLSKSSQDVGQRPRDVVRVYYAMETFCENLGTYTSLLTLWQRSQAHSTQAACSQASDTRLHTQKTWVNPVKKTAKPCTKF